MSGPPKYQVINGFNFAPGFVDVEDTLSYTARADDIFIVTYPKNGTTWTQHIVSLILNHGSLPPVYETSGILSVSPFLEAVGRKGLESWPRDQAFAIKSHLPFRLQPKNPKAKYIVMMRNVKDTVVSFYHHQHMFPGYGISDMDFHSFFPFFLRAEVEAGDYFSFIKGWWDHRNDPNVLILFYEHLKQDIESSVLKIARFLGSEYEQKLLADGNEILRSVIEKSSFDATKSSLNGAFIDYLKSCGLEVNEERRTFARKGVIGDWVNHLSQEESRQLDQRFEDEFTGTGLDQVWRQYDIFPTF